MEHIVQFAVSIDDQRIEQIVKEKAAKTIIDELKQEVRNKLFKASYYYKNANADDPLSVFSENIVRTVLNEDREKIIEKAVVMLSDRLARSKAGKAILSSLDSGGKSENDE